MDSPHTVILLMSRDVLSSDNVGAQCRGSVAAGASVGGSGWTATTVTHSAHGGRGGVTHSGRSGLPSPPTRRTGSAGARRRGRETIQDDDDEIPHEAVLPAVEDFVNTTELDDELASSECEEGLSHFAFVGGRSAWPSGHRWPDEDSDGELSRRSSVMTASTDSSCFTTIGENEPTLSFGDSRPSVLRDRGLPQGEEDDDLSDEGITEARGSRGHHRDIGGRGRDEDLMNHSAVALSGRRGGDGASSGGSDTSLGSRTSSLNFFRRGNRKNELGEIGKIQQQQQHLYFLTLVLPKTSSSDSDKHEEWRFPAKGLRNEWFRILTACLRFKPDLLRMRVEEEAAFRRRQEEMMARRRAEMGIVGGCGTMVMVKTKVGVGGNPLSGVEDSGGGDSRREKDDYTKVLRMGGAGSTIARATELCNAILRVDPGEPVPEEERPQPEPPKRPEISVEEFLELLEQAGCSFDVKHALCMEVSLV